MERQPIKGLPNHPDLQHLKSYKSEAPNGIWTGRLDDRAWGKSSNLFCYFTNLATGEGHRLSVFNNHRYQPYKVGPAFDKEPLGKNYQITTETSDNGLPKFLRADPL